MPSPFDQNDALIEDYQRTFLDRYEVAKEKIDEAYQKLKAADRADPSKWHALLREAEQAYRRVYPSGSASPEAQAFIRRVETKQTKAANRLSPDYVPNASGLDISKRNKILRDQIDAMQVLIDDYFDRVRQDAEVDESTGLIAAVPVAAAAGIFHRRAEFYGRDQAGRIYKDVTQEVAKQTRARRYEWLRTTSANPRERHLARVGNVYEFGELADEPGDLHNCKCGARLIWDDND